MDEKMLIPLQYRMAQISIGPSVARRMGPVGTIFCVRKFLSELELKRFKVRSNRSFKRELEKVTIELKSTLPNGASNWGSSRKFINLFLQEVQYNRFICELLNLYNLEPRLELPLDSHVAKGLRAEEGGNALPGWKTVIGLTPAVSEQYQSFANDVAKKKGFSRIHLDLLYWRKTNGTHK